MPEYTVKVGDREYDVDAPNESTAWKWANKTHEGFLGRVEKNKEQWAKEVDPTAGMGALEKGAANLGAGFADVQQAAQQMTGIGGTPSNEDVLAKRARDKPLAESTVTGLSPKIQTSFGEADLLPSAGSTLQVAGQVAPSLAIPASRVAGLPRALNAMVGGPVRAGMTGGAAAGATMPTAEGESRTLNTVAGGAGGAAIPSVLGATRGIAARASPQRRAGRVLTRALGDQGIADAERAVAAPVRQAGRSGQIPESAAARSGSTELGVLESELGRDAATRDLWAQFIREQNAQRYGSVRNATREADMLQGRDAARTTTTQPMREQALQRAGQDPWMASSVGQHVRDLVAGPTGTNPSVQRVADYVQRQLGPESRAPITPERLYEVRKVLADNLSGPHRIGDEMSSAVKGAERETLGMMHAIDAALDQASGGRWTPYLRTHERASRPVGASRAAQDVRRAFEGEAVPELGGAPEVTQTRLGKAMERERANRFDPDQPTLSPSATEELGAVRENIVRANEVQKARKMAGSAGGGSQTSTDIDAALKMLAGRSGIPGIGGIIDAVTQRASDATKIELTRLLQNPQAAIAAMRQAQQRGLPLSDAQQLLLQSTGRTVGIALPSAMQARQGGQ